MKLWSQIINHKNNFFFSGFAKLEGDDPSRNRAGKNERTTRKLISLMEQSLVERIKKVCLMHSGERQRRMQESLKQLLGIANDAFRKILDIKQTKVYPWANHCIVIVKHNTSWCIMICQVNATCQSYNSLFPMLSE